MMTRAAGKFTRNTLALGLAALTAAAASACSVNVKSQDSKSADSSGTLLLGADNGTPTFVRNFNPYASTKRVAANYMYEPLAVVNTLDGKATPWLATGHTQPDDKTLVFHIRKGVKWTDGKPLTAADVTFTFELLKKFPTLDTRGAWTHLTSVETDGDDVVLHLNTADRQAVFTLQQILIVPQHIWSKVKDPVKFANPNPVGTGPFVIDTFGANQYTLKRNTTYWQADKVKVEKVVLPASNTQLDVVKKGYDWAYAYMSDVDNTWVKADKKHNSYWFPAGGIMALAPNLAKAPFNNVDLRRGISFALDREKIADKAEEGYVKAAPQTGLMLPNYDEWKSPSIPNDGMIEQSRDKSLAAFAKAGYRLKGGKLVDAKGKQLSLSITVPNGYTDWVRGTQVIREELTAVGINVKLLQPQAAAYQQALQNGDFDLTFSAIGGGGSLYMAYNNVLNSEFKKPLGKPASANNERFSDPAADAALAQFKTAKTDAEQKAVVNKLQQIFYDKLPVISLFYGGLWGLSSDKEFTGWPSEKDPYSSLMTWDSPPLLVFTHLKPAK